MKHTSVESFLFEGPQQGLGLLVFGAIHGDELCGPVAIERVMENIRSGEIPLLQGSVRFVPVCNPIAYSEKKRVLKENLNRIFRKTETPKSEEAKLANELCPLVDACDVLLDIHSSFVPAPSNVFVDYPTPENLAFAKALSSEFLIFDWPKVYENNPFAFDSYTTDRYAHEAGKVGLLAECGMHDDPIAIERAERYILRTLAHFGLIEQNEPTDLSPSRSVYMTEIFRRESKDDLFAKEWHHLEAVPAGTKLATRATGEAIVAERDCFIIFPKEYALPGGEWFYVAVEHTGK